MRNWDSLKCRTIKRNVSIFYQSLLASVCQSKQLLWLSIRFLANSECSQRDGKLCSSGEGGTDSKDLPVCTCMCGSADDCGCVVDGSNAMAA